MFRIKKDLPVPKRKRLSWKYRVWYWVRPYFKRWQLLRKQALYKTEHKLRALNTLLRKPREHAVFLDTNVFTALLKRGQDVAPDFLFPFLGAEKWAKKGDLFHFAVSPFLLFEYLWIRIPQPANFKFDSTLTLEEAIRAVYNHAYEFYQQQEVTKISYLRRIYEEQLQKQAPAVQPFFYKMVGNYMTEKIEPVILSYLAWDIATKTIYPENIRRDSHIWFVAEAIGLLQQGMNVSCFRKFSEMSVNVARLDSWHMSEDERAELLREVPLKTSRDYVDSELPVVAVMGWNLPNGPHVTAHCFTCDRPAEVESRIVAAKANISFGYWLLRETKKNSAFPKLKVFPKYGFVHCLEEKTLKARESFNVRWIV